MGYKIAYNAIGRTGNNLFQYLACKLICNLFGCHQYIHIKSFSIATIVNDDTWIALSESPDPDNDSIFDPLKRSNIYMDGYFQDTRLFVRFRDIILDLVRDLSPNEKMPDNNCNMRLISKFINTRSPIYFNESDLVLSLRLDDFYQAKNPDGVSMVIPAEFYCQLLDSLDFDRLYIVCDKIRHNWEKKYLAVFDRFEPIHLIGGDLEHDCAVMREAPRLIHSNSTLCWINSFLTPTIKPKMERHIVQLTTDDENRMGIINPETDILHRVNPMTHFELLEL